MEFNDRLLYIARNLVEYKNYGGDLRKAAKVVHRYFPEKSLDECMSLLGDVCTVYQNAIDHVKANEQVYFDYFRSKDRAKVNRLEEKFIENQKDVSPEIMTAILGWVYNWHIER